MKKVDVVGAVIFNEKSEILCALRSQQMSLPGLWEFPGGKIEPGETPQQSLAEHERLIWLPLDQLDTLEWAPADLPTLQELKKLI